MFWSSLILPLLAAPACLAAPAPEKRATYSDATLYAYGQNISGYPVLFSATGALYVSSSNTTSLQPITWDIPSMSQSTDKLTNGTLFDGTAVGALYIDTVDSLYNEVVVTGAPNATTVVNGTTGITTYGTQLVYYNGSAIQSSFWAQLIQQTRGDLVFALHWNVNNELRSGAVPVVLKTIAPSETS